MKVLVVRFSSIGDIVLTSPIVRAIDEQIPNAEIHFITKKPFRILLEDNKRIKKVWTIDKSTKELTKELRAEKFDHVVDLHRNIRTMGLKWRLRRPSSTFPKLNFSKWVLVRLKHNRMPNVHIVDRYFKAVEKIGVKNDSKKGEFFIAEKNRVDLTRFDLQAKGYLGVVMGAKFSTKSLPIEKLTNILSEIKEPIVLLGGPDDLSKSIELQNLLPNNIIVNTCGKLNLQESAFMCQSARVILTNDTGLMHIAACYDTPIVSIWGNTVPELGMYPYHPKEKSFTIHQVNDLKCRPCSKIGFQGCPKGHFKCMMNQNETAILADLKVKG